MLKYMLSKIHIKLFQTWKWARYIHMYIYIFKCKQAGQGRVVFNWRFAYELLYFLLLCGCWNK
jgi:hypothetical protein